VGQFWESALLNQVDYFRVRHDPGDISEQAKNP